MTILPVEPHEIPALHAFIEGAYRGDSARRGWSHEAELLGGQRTDVVELSVIVADPRQCLLALRTADGLLGCVQVADKGDGIGYLGLLAVDPERQAQGVGGVLLGAAERYAAENYGAVTIEMLVIKQRVELIAYYKRRGYCPTGREEPFPLDDERFGLPKLRDLAFAVLTKPLGPP